MRTGSIAAATALLLAACGGGEEAGNEAGNAAAPSAPAIDNATKATNAAAPPPTAWALQSSGEGAALVLTAGRGAAAMRLFCAAGEGRILVNVPSFRPIGSEERLSFGGSGDAVALVADPGGDRARGGVSGAGPVPADLAALIAGGVSASYGAQTSGPHPAPPADLARRFAAACGERPAAPATPAPAPTPPAAAGPCGMQGSERLRVAALRAVGTEPFWAARIDGRCVTYSHPEDQAGTRVWTRYTASGNAGGGTWEGALGGRRFALTIRPAPGCSDGMSDRLYPFAAELVVGGERRSGCAGPA